MFVNRSYRKPITDCILKDRYFYVLNAAVSVTIVNLLKNKFQKDFPFTAKYQVFSDFSHSTLTHIL